MPSPNLRVTRRCLEDDLGLDGGLVEQDAREFKNDHPAVKKFVAMRGAAPDGAEPTYGPYKRGFIGSLHVGSARAVTTWDEVEDVCWLLGYNDFHRNGDPDDAFEVFNKQFLDGVLLPTVADYDALLSEPDDLFHDLMLATGRRLLEQARANPGNEEFATFGDGVEQVMCVDILVEGGERAEDGWVGVTLPENKPLPDEEVYAVVAELIPEGALPIYEMKFKDRERRPGEIVYRWEHYEVDQRGND